MAVDYKRLGRKMTLTLFNAQSLGSAGFIAAATINSIAGAKLSGNPALAGVPSGIYQLGGALAAFGWGYGMDRLGRRGAITLGLVLGVLGAGLASGAFVMSSLWTFLGGMVFMGAANSALQLSRFAAAEVHPPAERGRAISNVVIGGTVGAVLGPLLVGPTGEWSKRLGTDELAGPYAASLLLFALAAALVYLFLRPDPREIGRAMARLYPETSDSRDQTRPILEILATPGAMVATAAMVFGQLTMILLMVITSLHMKDHAHVLSDISLVIASHTFGMYAFSILSGRATDRFGRVAVIAFGAVMLILACLTAPLSPEILPISAALFLLGLGWNFCYVGGSTLLADQLSPSERARTQGFNDLLVGLVSALGSLSSGVVFATLGYATVGIIGAAVSTLPLALVLWWSLSRRGAAAA